MVKSALPKPTRYCASRSPKSFWDKPVLLYCKSEFEKYKHIYFLIIGERGPSGRNLGYNSFDKGWWNYETRKRQRSI